jgi:hypothetical protein
MYRVESGAHLLHLLLAPAEVATRGQDVPHRIGSAAEDRPDGSTDLVDLDIDLGVLVCVIRAARPSRLASRNSHRIRRNRRRIRSRPASPVRPWGIQCTASAAP